MGTCSDSAGGRASRWTVRKSSPRWSRTPGSAAPSTGMWNLSSPSTVNLSRRCRQNLVHFWTLKFWRLLLVLIRVLWCSLTETWIEWVRDQFSLWTQAFNCSWANQRSFLFFGPITSRSPRERSTLQGTHITTSKNPVAWRFESLLEMQSLAPETRGCRFQWEADQLKFHSRFLHLFHFSVNLFLFIHPCSSQPSSWYWWLSRPIFPCSFFVCPHISSPSSFPFPLLEFAPPPPPLSLHRPYHSCHSLSPPSTPFSYYSMLDEHSCTLV